MSIDRYVMALRTRLTVPPSRAAELVEETRAHLEDAARDLQMAGLAPLESEREAIRRFGAPEEIACALLGAERPARRGARRPIVGLLAATIVGIALCGSAVASAYAAPHPASVYHAPAASIHHASSAQTAQREAR